MAMKAREVEEMLAVSKETGKLLQIGFVRRFGGDADAICKLTAVGTIGDIYYEKATYLRRDGCPGGWFGNKAYSSSGGLLIDLGVYVIDLSCYPAQSSGVRGNSFHASPAGRADNGRSLLLLMILHPGISSRTPSSYIAPSSAGMFSSDITTPPLVSSSFVLSFWCGFWNL